MKHITGSHLFWFSEPTLGRKATRRDDFANGEMGKWLIQNGVKYDMGNSDYEGSFLIIFDGEAAQRFMDQFKHRMTA